VKVKQAQILFVFVGAVGIAAAVQDAEKMDDPCAGRPNDEACLFNLEEPIEPIGGGQAPAWRVLTVPTSAGSAKGLSVDPKLFDIWK
jgi:hypothetical protein